MRGVVVREAAARQEGIRGYGPERLKERGELLTRIRSPDLLEDSPAVRRESINKRHAAGSGLLLLFTRADDLIERPGIDHA